MEIATGIKMGRSINPELLWRFGFVASVLAPVNWRSPRRRPLLNYNPKKKVLTFVKSGCFVFAWLISRRMQSEKRVHPDGGSLRVSL